jgi:hypothetical protein
VSAEDLRYVKVKLAAGQAHDGRSSPLVAHAFPTFAVGGAQVRFAAIANHFGNGFRHIIVSLDGNLTCRERLDAGLEVAFPAVAATKNAMLANAWRYRSLLHGWKPDVLVTYNWGAIEFASPTSCRLPVICMWWTDLDRKSEQPRSHAAC